MKLQILEQTIEIENSTVKDIVETINSLLQDSNQNINYMIIDGIEVYNDMEEYINESFNEIKEIIVKTASVDQLKDNLNDSLILYINRALPEIEAVAQEFYKGSLQSTWEKFGQLLEGMNWITHAIQSLSQTSDKSEKLEEISAKMNEQATTLLDAVEVKDMVLIADIIQYEIIETLNELFIVLNHNNSN